MSELTWSYSRNRGTLRHGCPAAVRMFPFHVSVFSNNRIIHIRQVVVSRLVLVDCV